MSVAAAQKRRKVLIAAVAALVASGAFVVGLNTLSKGSGAPTGIPSVVAMTNVVAVDADLPVQTKIVAANLRTVQFPTAQLTSDNVTTMAEAVGKVNVVPLSAGTILLTSELQSDFVNELSLKLNPGDVAVAIPFDESKGFGGFIQPEDRFDILCDSGDNLPAYYCFTDVRVLEVGGLSQQPTPAAATAGAPALPGAPPPAATAPPQVLNESVVVVEMSRADGARLEGVLHQQPPTGEGTIVAYVLRAHADFNPSASP